MPAKFRIDRKNAQTFEVVHRARDDPLYFDDDASQSVLVETAKSKKKNQKIISGSELAAQANEFKKQGRRDNEGEAALYGITFDDSNYDYMQHLKPIGQSAGSVFVSKTGEMSVADSEPGSSSREPPVQQQQQPSRRRNRGNVLQFRDEIEEEAPAPTTQKRFELPQEVVPSAVAVPVRQHDVPDEIRGFQPNLDPRLREVLEALDDEEFVDDDEDIFSELIAGGEAQDEDDWKSTLPEEELVQRPGEADWEFDFRKFKLESKKAAAAAAAGSDDEYDDDADSLNGGYAESVEVPSDEEFDSAKPFGFGVGRKNNATEDMHGEKQDSFGALPSIQPKKPRKKKIGAKTDLSGYSMSSSASFRTNGLVQLDDQFEEFEAEYAENNDDEPEQEPEFDLSKERPDLESILDDFLATSGAQAPLGRKARKAK